MSNLLHRLRTYLALIAVKAGPIQNILLFRRMRFRQLASGGVMKELPEELSELYNLYVEKDRKKDITVAISMAKLEEMLDGRNMDASLIYKLNDIIFEYASKHPESVSELNLQVNNITLDAIPLWKDREDKSQNPVEFIMREYSHLISKGLNQSHIRKHDKPLYNAFHYWKKHNDLPEGLRIPTKSEFLAQSLQDVTEDDARKARQIVGAFTRAEADKGKAKKPAKG